MLVLSLTLRIAGIEVPMFLCFGGDVGLNGDPACDRDVSKRYRGRKRWDTCIYI